MKRRVVITGIGIIAPNGIGKENFWDALKEGKSGISKITRFDASSYPSQIAGEVNDFEPTDYMSPRRARRIGRASQFALATVKMALEDAKLNINARNCKEIGVVMGVGSCQIDIAEFTYSVFIEKGIRRLPPFALEAFFPNASTGQISIEFGIKGPQLTISTGCSSGLNAVGIAQSMIQSGNAEVMLAGGTEATITPFGIGTACAAGILSTQNDNPEQASRPFDRKRDGLVIAEGAGVLVLESLESAVRRQAHIYCELTGYSTTSEAFSMIEVNEGGTDFARAIKLALINAGLSPNNSIDYISAHATSFPINDVRECNAIKKVFDEKAYSIPVSSIKSMIGMPYAAAGPLQIISSILAFEKDILPPTTNYELFDPKCDLDFIPHKYREVKNINNALVNSFGYGGSNVCIVLSRFR